MVSGAARDTRRTIRCDLTRRCWRGMGGYSADFCSGRIAAVRGGRRSWMRGGGTGVRRRQRWRSGLACRWKRQTKHTGTKRDVVPPLLFRYLIPSTPALRDMGEASLLHREGYRPVCACPIAVAALRDTMPSLPKVTIPPVPTWDAVPLCWGRNQVTSTYFWASSFPALGYPGNPPDTRRNG